MMNIQNICRFCWITQTTHRKLSNPLIKNILLSSNLQILFAVHWNLMRKQLTIRALTLSLSLYFEKDFDCMKTDTGLWVQLPLHVLYVSLVANWMHSKCNTWNYILRQNLSFYARFFSSFDTVILCAKVCRSIHHLKFPDLCGSSKISWLASLLNVSRIEVPYAGVRGQEAAFCLMSYIVWRGCELQGMPLCHKYREKRSGAKSRILYVCRLCLVWLRWQRVVLKGGWPERVVNGDTLMLDEEFHLIHTNLGAFVFECSRCVRYQRSV